MGGLSRRNTVIEKERAAGPVVVIDGGNTWMSQEPVASMGEHALEQRRLKADLIGEAYALAGIDAVAFGPQDWSLGTDWMLEMAARHKLPLLAGNLRCPGKDAYPGHVVVEREGRRIGLVGVAVGPVDGCEVGDIREALVAAAEAMGPVDIRIGLVPTADMKVLGTALERGAPIDLVVDGRGNHSFAMPEVIGGVFSYGAGSRGKALGVLRLDFEPNATAWKPPIPVEDLQRRITSAQDRKKMAESRAAGEADPARKERWTRQVEAYNSQIVQLEVELSKSTGESGPMNLLKGEEVSLDTEIADHAATLALVDAAKSKMSAEVGDPQKHLPPHRAAATSPFAGAELCRSCHPSQYIQWAGTKHATALQSLVDDKRHLDDQCFSCHVTGAAQEGGPKTPLEVHGLRDVQCEACHGAARAHLARPDDKAVMPTRDPGQQACVTCHDGKVDDGRFDYPAYLPKVVHAGNPPPTTTAPETGAH